MDGPGQGSPPAEFGLEGFEEDSERVKDAVARRRDEAGGHDDPAVKKLFFFLRTHRFLDPLKSYQRTLGKATGFLRRSPGISRLPGPFPCKRGAGNWVIIAPFVCFVRGR